MTPNRIAFLLGAGASLGPGHTDPNSPPLGKDLYDALAAEYPATWGPQSMLGRRYADALRADFETAFSNEISMNIPAIDVLEWDRDIARFFARFSPNKTRQDLYTRLLDFLKTTGMLAATTFASLNYDCLFELAAASLGLSVNYSALDPHPSAVQVLKIHGSSNFITEELSAWRPYLTNPGSFLDCSMATLSPQNLVQSLEEKFRESTGLYFYPVLSRYAFGKNTHVAGSRIQQLRNAWSQEAAQATHLAIVGVRFNSRDTHIIEPVTQAQAQTILYVGSSQDFEGWRSINPKCQHMGERFQESFDKLCDGLLPAGTGS